MKFSEELATEKQLAFIEKLKKAKGLEIVKTPELTKYEAGILISKLLGKSNKQRIKERKEYYEDLHNQQKIIYQIQQNI